MAAHTGILHVHSVHSYDGQHSLLEIRELAGRRGYAFVGITEHSNTLTRTGVDRLAGECRALSSDGCRLIPGIEFSCRGGLHLIGYGLTRYSDATDPVVLARFIRRHGALAVVAHPQRYLDRIPLDLAPLLHGIEVWNLRYDGRFVPNPTSWALLARFQRRNPAIRAFGGLDLHEITAMSHVRTIAEADGTSDAAVLAALAAGRFTLGSPWLTLRADGHRTPPQKLGMAAGRRAYDLLKGVRDRLGRRRAPAPPAGTAPAREPDAVRRPAASGRG